MAVKPWRQALWTKAEASHDLPMPVGPVIEQIVVLADPAAGAETEHDLAAEPAGRG